LQNLVVQLRLPDTFIASNRSRTTSLEALMMLCSRLVDGARLVLQVNLFGRDPTQCDRFINDMLDWIFDRWAKGLMKWNPLLMSPERCEYLAAAAVDKGSPFDNLVCLVDGTVVRISRPEEGQRAVSGLSDSSKHD